MDASKAWKQTEATIYTANYIGPVGEMRPCWQVTYNYRIDNEYYSGEFTDYATDSEVEYHRDDSIKIEYSTARPDKSRVPGSVSYWSKAKVPFAIGGALGLVVIVLYILAHSQR